MLLAALRSFFVGDALQERVHGGVDLGACAPPASPKRRRRRAAAGDDDAVVLVLVAQRLEPVAQLQAETQSSWL